MLFNKETKISDIIERLSLGSITGISFQRAKLVPNAFQITMITDTNHRITQIIRDSEFYDNCFDIVKYTSERMTEELYQNDRGEYDADSI